MKVCECQKVLCLDRAHACAGAGHCSLIPLVPERSGPQHHCASPVTVLAWAMFPVPFLPVPVSVPWALCRARGCVQEGHLRLPSASGKRWGLACAIIDSSVAAIEEACAFGAVERLAGMPVAVSVPVHGRARL